MRVVNLGLTDFHIALAEQERLVPLIAAGEEPETLLLTEHLPVYTCGRLGKAENLLDPAVRPVTINRGGEVTWHGPGQLVGYPLVDLGRRGRDLHRYLRLLEQGVIAVCAAFGVAGFRRSGLTGVWTDEGKIASVGVGVRRWVTMHGFALNVDPDPVAFARINPCGIPGCPVASLAAAGVAVSVEAAARETAAIFPSLLEEHLPVHDRLV